MYLKLLGLHLNEKFEVIFFSEFAFKNIQPAVIVPSEFLSVALLTEDIRLHKTDHSPPLLSQQDIYIQNRVFRI